MGPRSSVTSSLSDSSYARTGGRRDETPGRAGTPSDKDRPILLDRALHHYQSLAGIWQSAQSRQTRNHPSAVDEVRPKSVVCLLGRLLPYAAKPGRFLSRKLGQRSAPCSGVISA